MALTSKIVRRVELEHEPGEWIEVRMPSVQMLSEIDWQGEPIGAMVSLLQHCVLRWSYPEPVTPENVADLDQETATRLATVLAPTEEAAEEKKDSGSSTRPSKD